jgi:hypothetical protein
MIEPSLGTLLRDTHANHSLGATGRVNQRRRRFLVSRRRTRFGTPNTERVCPVRNDGARRPDKTRIFISSWCVRPSAAAEPPRKIYAVQHVHRYDKLNKIGLGAEGLPSASLREVDDNGVEE